jgi:hypothetical protein
MSTRAYRIDACLDYHKSGIGLVGSVILLKKGKKWKQFPS